MFSFTFGILHLVCRVLALLTSSSRETETIGKNYQRNVNDKMFQWVMCTNTLWPARLRHLPLHMTYRKRPLFHKCLLTLDSHTIAGPPTIFIVKSFVLVFASLDQLHSTARTAHITAPSTARSTARSTVRSTACSTAHAAHAAQRAAHNIPTIPHATNQSPCVYPQPWTPTT